LIDRVAKYALALSYADGRFTMLSRAVDELPSMDSRAAAIESKLVPALQLSISMGIVKGVALSNLPTVHGYSTRITRIRSMAITLREQWPQLDGKLPFNVALLDEAEALSVSMTEALGIRDRRDARVVAAARDRQAAFTKLFTTWGKIRKVVQFVTETAEEADRIAPTIFIRSAPTKNKTDSSSQSAPDDATASAPDTTPAAATSPTPGAVASPESAPASKKLGGSPFTH
jgi:hypothetical protein